MDAPTSLLSFCVCLTSGEGESVLMCCCGFFIIICIGMLTTFPITSQINIWVVCFFVIHIQQSFSSPWGIVAENISLKSGFKS